MPVYLLIDNGSKQPQATLRLRELAEKLSEKSGKTIHPVSLQHADAIDAGELGNVPANTFYSFLQKQLVQGEKKFIVLPLFFGMSRALTSFIPEQVRLLEEAHGSFVLKLADVVFPLPQGEKHLAEILKDHIQTSVTGSLENKSIVVVDHGSPSPKITQVRNKVAELLRSMLDGITIEEAVMERRAGSKYDFNGDLLEDYLKQQAEKGNYDIVIAMLFFLPGRHAGACGDVEEICNNVIKQFPDLKITITPLIGEHELLISILHNRLLAV